MPRKDGTGPDGNGPKRTNKGIPTPKRNGRGRGSEEQGQKRGGIGRRGGNR